MEKPNSRASYLAKRKSLCRRKEALRSMGRADAKKCADQNPGYKVFDADGNVVYKPKTVETAEKVLFLVKVSLMFRRLFFRGIT